MVKVNSTHIILVGIIVIIIAAVFYGYFNLQSSEGEGNPRIQVTPTSYNFGDISPGLVSHTFIVKNIGKSTLEIKRVSTSCGCTKATIDSEKIEPGQSTNLLVTYDPRLMDSFEGEHLSIVYIKSNDPEKPEIEIEIRANVI